MASVQSVKIQGSSETENHFEGAGVDGRLQGRVSDDFKMSSPKE